MFYAQFVLSKKGPLAKIWLAAHWEKKLSKAQIYETNVQDAVAEIIQPKVKLSLRTTGHLLLGIVRIYSRKAKYVLADCNEAFLKLKMAFKHGGACDLALRDREDRSGANDIPEAITDFYDNLPEINDFEMGPMREFQANQSRIDDITLREDRFETYNRGLDFVASADGEGFDDFGERDQLRRSRSRSIFEEMEEEVEQQRRGDPHTSAGGHSFAHPRESSLLKEDGAPHKGGEGFDLFGNDNDFNDFGTAEDLDLLFNTTDINRELGLDRHAASTPMAPGAGEDDEQPMEVDRVSANELSFQLEPIQQQPPQERQIRHKRKRKLIIDEHKNISGEEMKANMADYSETMQPLDLAPPTKQLMRLRENGQLEKMLTMPACMEWILDPGILKIYQSHLEPHALEATDIALTDELHRDLELTDTIDDDYGHDQPASVETNENLVPNIDEAGNVTPVPEADEVLTSPTGAEKRASARRPRIHDKEEEEGEEEELFTRRTKNVLQSIATRLRVSEDDKIVFDDLLTKGSTRRTAAQKFYALLELKKWQAIEVEQSEPYGPIEISSGSRLQETMKLPV